MKKITLLLFLLISSLGFSQTILESFEAAAPVLSAENGVTATIAANPTLSAEKSMKIVTGAGQSWQGGKLMMQTNKIDMRTSDKTLSVKIWSDAARDFLLKLTDGDGGAGNDSKTYVAHSGSGWETLNADFSVSADTGQGGIVANDQYSGLTFYPLYNNSGTSAGGWYDIPDPAYTNYIDDISGIAGDALGTSAEMTVLESFEDDAPVLSAENGVTATIAANPTVSAEKSMKIVTGAGQSWQGGKLMMQTNKIDMRTSDKTLSVKIWSDAARDFLLKLTDGDGGAGNDSKTYVAHSGSGWETLNADFSVSADTGQGGIVANDQYSGLTFYPLYNNSGTSAGGWYDIPDPAYTNYIDDISGIAGDALGTSAEMTVLESFEDDAPVLSAENGVTATIAANPTVSAEKSMKIVTGAGQSWQGGKLMMQTNKIDMRTSDKTLSVKIWSDAARDFLLKLTDGDGGTGTESKTYVAHTGSGWETLIADFSVRADTGQGGVVANDQYQGLTFFPLYNNSGTSAGGWYDIPDPAYTNYIDDISGIAGDAIATAGISDNKLLKISMYPNPTSSRLTISAQSTIKSAAIYNLLGKEVMNLEINKNSESIDVSNLASGMYLIKYRIDNAIGTAKFIKQ